MMGGFWRVKSCLEESCPWVPPPRGFCSRLWVREKWHLKFYCAESLRFRFFKKISDSLIHSKHHINMLETMPQIISTCSTPTIWGWVQIIFPLDWEDLIKYQLFLAWVVYLFKIYCAMKVFVLPSYIFGKFQMINVQKQQKTIVFPHNEVKQWYSIPSLLPQRKGSMMPGLLQPTFHNS